MKLYADTTFNNCRRLETGYKLQLCSLTDVLTFLTFAKHVLIGHIVVNKTRPVIY